MVFIGLFSSGSVLCLKGIKGYKFILSSRSGKDGGIKNEKVDFLFIK